MNLKRTKRNLFLIISSLMLGCVVFQGFYENITAPNLISHFNTSLENIVLPETKVGVAKSSRENASEITFAEIETLVRQAVELAGGFEELITDGDVVILKPNLVSDYEETLSPQTLPPEVNGMTTDYRLVQAVVNLVRERNPNGMVYILEGVANGTTRGNMETLFYDENHISGVDDFLYLEEISGGYREYSSENLVEVTLPENVQLYADYMKPNNSSAYYLNKIYFEADVLISLPVLKNHSISNVTGAVKNVGIGATPQNIYGGAPGDNHRWVNNVIDHFPTNLHYWIHDFYLCRPVDYAIMDGLQGSKNGPTGQGSLNLAAAQQNMRLILAGKDAVAVDAIASLMMSYDPQNVRHLVHLHNNNAGCAETSLISVRGINIPDVKKYYPSAYREDIYGWYTDSTPPNVVVNSSYADNDEIHLDLSVDPETVKIELAVDGEIIDQTAVSDYDNIRFDLPNLTDGEHVFTIYAYDRFLNRSEVVLNIVTDVDDNINETPGSFGLLQNYPNPFNPTTTIEFNLSASGHVNLSVYSITGEKITTLVDDYKSAGTHSFLFDASNQSSGIYLYQLNTSGLSKTKQMVLVK
ncbi:DUF362 domain-containing protein [Bacteroidota bacterium]